MHQTVDDSSPPVPPRIDHDRFLSQSNASLKRIERTSLLILGLGGGIGFAFFGNTGFSFILGGLLAMLHYRSLHRMFQKRILDPPARLKTQFTYSLTLFLMICFFFWIIQDVSINTSGVVIGFFLMSGAVVFESSQR